MCVERDLLWLLDACCYSQLSNVLTWSLSLIMVSDDGGVFFLGPHSERRGEGEKEK